MNLNLEGIEKGYIKVYRKILNGPLASYGDSMLGLALRLLLKANHKEGFFLGTRIMPGQLIISQHEFAKQGGHSLSSFHRKLKVMEGFGFIEIEAKHSYTLITVINYISYQKLLTAGETSKSRHQQAEQENPKNGTLTETGTEHINPNNISEIQEDIPAPETQYETAELSSETLMKTIKEYKNDNNEKKKENYLEDVNSSHLPQSRSKRLSVCFDYETKQFKNIKDTDIDLWQKTYPALNIASEIQKAASWLDANANLKRKGNKAFLNNWFIRAEKWNPPAKGAADPFESLRKKYQNQEEEKADEE